MAMNSKNFDVLVVGAGPVGCTAAQSLATNGHTVRVIEKRDHIAGNCFDVHDEHGILIHKYGPHFFRTNNEEIFTFLSRFTEWIDAKYIVKSRHKDRLYPFPINIETLELFFSRQLDESAGRTLLDTLRVHYEHPPRNSEEFVLSRIGHELYEAFYLDYTIKQWGRHPRDLDASVCGRVPIRLNRDNRYVDHKIQVMPKDGFTALFSRMLNHANITVELNQDFENLKPSIGNYKALLYTGPIDAYFNCSLGRLPWRSLNFRFENYNQEFVQECPTVNYPDSDVPYTRSAEVKHVTGQKSKSTTVCYETPSATGDPYYPVPEQKARELYQRYKELAENERASNNVFFAGRLAQYAYLDTDEAILTGLRTAESMQRTLLDR